MGLLVAIKTLKGLILNSCLPKRLDDSLLFHSKYFLFITEASLKEEVDKSLKMKPEYETIVARAKLAMVSH